MVNMGAGEGEIPAYLQSASTLIKALKSPEDPPQPSLPAKIDIALQAWRNDTLCIPRKAEVLYEWVLETLLRHRSKKQKESNTLNPLSDARYLQLLYYILEDRLSTPQASTSTSATAFTLPPTLLSAFFEALKSADNNRPSVNPTLLDAATRTFKLGYKGVREVKVDTWMEIWKACIEFLASERSRSTEPVNQGSSTGWETRLGDLVDIVMSLWRPDDTLGESQIKRNTATLYESLSTLIQAQSLHPAISALHQNKLFLPSPILRDFDPLQPLLSSLSSLPPSLVGFTATSFLPQLLKGYIDLLSRNKYQIFTQPSSSKRSFDVFVSDKLRAAVQSGFKAILDFIDGITPLLTAAQPQDGSRPHDVWAGRVAVWEEIDSWGGYLETDESWSIILGTEARRAKEALMGVGAMRDPKIHAALLALLDVLERLDHSRADIGPEVVGWCLASPKHCHAAAETLISSMLRYHHLTFSLDKFFASLHEALAGLFPESLDSAIVRQLYTLVAEGPLFSSRLQLAIPSAFSGLSTSSIRISVLSFLTQEETYDEQSGETTTKRKRSTDPVTKENQAAMIAFKACVACLALPSGRSAMLEDDDTYDALIETILGEMTALEESSAAEVEGKKRKKSRKSDTGPSHAPDWARDILLSARLRLLRGLQSVNRAWKPERPLPGQLISLLKNQATMTDTRIEILRYISQTLLLSVDEALNGAKEVIREYLDIWLDLLLQGSESGGSSLGGTRDAAWSLLAEEGLFVSDSFAGPEQNQRLLSILSGQLASGLGCGKVGNPAAATAESIVISPSTWELSNLRTSLISTLGTILQAKEGLQSDLIRIIAIIPTMVIPRDLREKLARSLCDEILRTSTKQAPPIPVMTWLARLARDADSIRWIDLHLLGRLVDYQVARPNGEVDEQIIELIASLLRHALRQGEAQHKTVAECMDKISGKVKATGVGRAQGVNSTRVLGVFLQILDSQPDHTGELRSQIKSLVESAIDGLVALDLEHVLHDHHESLHTLRMWIPSLRLSRNLELKKPELSLADKLLKVVGHEEDDELPPLILQIVHEENGAQYSERTLAVLTILNAIRPTDSVNDVFARMMESASLEDFNLALESSIEALRTCQTRSGSQIDPARMTTAHLRTIQILVGVPLEGSGKVMRRLCSSLLDEIANAVQAGGIEECFAGVRCLERFVSSRSRILRPLDLATVLEILSSALQPRSTIARPNSSNFNMFDSILATLSTITRQRADLIVDTSPAVAGVISKFFVLFFEPRRAYFGSIRGRQRVTSRWPPWLADPTPSYKTSSPHGGLHAVHASQLARFLTNLCNAKIERDAPSSKSRDPSSFNPSKGSVGIASSLVKHVPSVLVSYCRAVGDPYGSLSPEVRKELEPGLWALCEILTVGGRVNARGREGEGLGIPFGLGEAGEVEKEVWAGLWLKWNKSRYQGKG